VRCCIWRSWNGLRRRGRRFRRREWPWRRSVGWEDGEFGILAGEVVLIAGHEADGFVFDEGDGSVAVPFDFEKPGRGRRRLFRGSASMGWILWGKGLGLFSPREAREIRRKMRLCRIFFWRSLRFFSVRFVSSSLATASASHAALSLPFGPAGRLIHSASCWAAISRMSGW